MKTGIGIEAKDGELSVYLKAQGTPDVPESRIPLSLSPIEPSMVPSGMKPVRVLLGGQGTSEIRYACLGGKYAMFNPNTENYCLVKQ